MTGRVKQRRAPGGTSGGAAPRVRTAVLQSLEARVMSRGGPPIDTLLSQAGLPDRNVVAQGNDIPLHAFSVLLEHASRSIDEECLALELARSYPIGSSGVFGYLLSNAADTRTLIRTYSAYIPTQVDALNVKFEEGGQQSCITWELPAFFLGPRRPVLELAIGLFVERARGLFVPDWSPSRAEFEFRAPTRLDLYATHFGSNLRFEAGSNRIWIESELLSAPNRARPDSRLFATLEAVARSQLEGVLAARELKGADRRDLLTKLSIYFIDNLETGRVDLDGTAHALRMSTRELQGELRRRDTSFVAELKNVRRSLAERYLRETNLPMSEIAFLLGFSEQSAFARAARNWFQKPPSAFRQETDAD